MFHVVATYDGRGGGQANEGINIYINGGQETLVYSPTLGSPNSYTNMSNTTQPVLISTYGFSGHNDGKISNVAIFDRELTNQEALKIYNNGVTQDLQTASSFNNNIVAWWPMDQRSSYYDGSNWIVRDLENGNDGTGVNVNF